MAKSLKQIQQDVNKFSIERGWINADPNQLISSIVIELAELAEHFQWEKDFNKVKNYSDEKKKELGFEFMDVLFYLLRLASASEIDVEKYFYLKLPKLAEKYKIGGNYLKAKQNYRKLGLNKTYGA